jgi:hypothetical protein
VPILRDCVIHYGGADLTATANEFAVDLSYADQDVTTFGSSGNRERIAGLEDATASVMTFGDPEVVEPNLATREGDVELLTAVQFPTGGAATVGDRVYALRGLLLSTKQPMKVGDVSKLDASLSQARPEGLLAGQLLAPKATISATTNGTAVNLGAQTAPRIVYLGVHVFALTGDRTVTLKLQSATASGFSSPTDRVSLSTITAAGSGFGSSSTATTNAWWRVVATLGGTTGSVTFAAFAAVQ